MLIDAFYSLFGIMAQIPASIVVEFIGRKNSIILANILNCLYMVVIMFSNSLFNLLTAEILSALAFGIKEIAEPSLLNESILPSKYKSDIFSKINVKGATGYYVINAISTIIAGVLYGLNPYLPIIISLVVLV